MKTLGLCIFGCDIRVECSDQYVESLLAANYGWFRGQSKKPHLQYLICRDSMSQRFTINRDRVDPLVAADDGELLFLFEKDITIEVQKYRRSLYFLHSAALEFAGRAFLLVAPSGAGKSTTTWGLLHRGFHYMSDELAPVGLEKMEVHPYPHAICLKSKPRYPYLLPNRTLYTSRTVHVATELLPGKIVRDPIPSIAIFFLQCGWQSSRPTIKPISKAEAAARLFANALNPLAHKGDGLDAAVEIVSRNVCFDLTIADLSATCTLVRNTLETLSNEQEPAPVLRGD